MESPQHHQDITVSLQCSKRVDEDQLQENKIGVAQLVISSLNELNQCTGSECVGHPPRPRAPQREATLLALVYKNKSRRNGTSRPQVGYRLPRCFNIQCLTTEYSVFVMS